MAIRFQNLSEKLYNVFEKFHFPKKKKKSPKKTKKIVVTPKVEELQSSFTYQKIAFHESFPKVVRKVF